MTPDKAKNLEGLSPVFKEASKILEKVQKKKGSVKNLIYDSARKKHLNVRFLYAVVYETLKHSTQFSKILRKVPQLSTELKVDDNLIYILLFEFFYGKKSLPLFYTNILMKYRMKIEKILSKTEKENKSDKVAFWHPRYTRVNTLLASVKKAKRLLKKEGYEEISLEETSTFEDFMTLIKGLEKNQFVRDYHFKDVLVFSHGVDLSVSDLYQSGQLILTDKASCIPVYALDPKPGSHVLDACAAPGLKTCHIAAKMQGSGKLIAVDRDHSRLKDLRKIIETSGVSNCTVLKKDFTSINPMQQPFNSVEMILLDPSCSGSGIVNRLDFVTGSKNSENNARLEKLSNFQITMLKHALKFPNVKRIVYSTCSLSVIENEHVIQEVLNSCGSDFVVKPIFEEWPERGESDFEFGSHCIRCYPEKHCTNGFFVAMLEKNLENGNASPTSNSNTENATKIKKKEKKLLPKVEQKPQKRKRKSSESQSEVKRPKLAVSETE